MTGSSESSGHRRPPAEQAAGRHRRLGALRHEALLLAMQGRHAEAGRLLIDRLGVEPDAVRRLQGEARRLLSVAATYLQKAGDTATAAHLFQLLGEEERAARSHATPDSGPETAGTERPPAPATERNDIDEARPADSPPASAGRMPPMPQPPGSARSDRTALLGRAKQLVRAGQAARAAQELSVAGLHYEAGVCFVKSGDGLGALSQLTRVPGTSPQYRPAARTALRILTRLGQCTADLAEYLQAFVSGGPSSDEELRAFIRWSELLGEQGLLDHARLCVAAAASRYPGHPLLEGRLEQLGPASVSHTLWAESHSASSASAAAPEPPPHSPTQPSVGVEVSGARAAAFAPGSSASDARPAVAPYAPASGSGSRRERPATVRVSSLPPASTSTPVQLEPGVVVGDRFRLEAEIGRGGMATVFSATDLELDEEVALKVFSGQLVTADRVADAVARFREELKVCRRLRHPNIIQVYDIGIHGGHRYFTMELLRGRSLDAYVGQRLPLEWTLRCLIQACTGLHAAHERGVVHRDVKPENIFLTDAGVVKIMDFGIAKSGYKRGQTAMGTLAGTPEYMAPEQITGFSSVGPAADQYSLGIVAYYMLTGQLPFHHEELMPLLMMHREQSPTPPRTLLPELPQPLNDAVLRMLAKDPVGRFESCAVVAALLAELTG